MSAETYPVQVEASPGPRLPRRLLLLTCFLVIVGLVYARFLRPWHLHWGATVQEAGGEVAGDDLMPDPDLVATRAIEINAPPSAIWPWLVRAEHLAGRAP